MLTANRFDHIKKMVRVFKASKGVRLSDTNIENALTMLEECVLEIDRMRGVPTIAGRGHVRPVVLDGEGRPVPPPPIEQQLAVERREQYDADRYEAVMAAPDIGPWRVFSLRWGLAPPPGGWENDAVILNVIHAVRLSLKQVPYIDKHFSAVHLTSNGIGLPHGVTLVNGELRGVKLP
jgi:hypothetical protein